MLPASPPTLATSDTTRRRHVGDGLICDRQLRRRLMRGWLLACALLAGLAPTSAQAAEAQTVVHLDAVEIGFDHRCKIGRWTPLTATLSGEIPADVAVRAVCADPDGSDAVFPLKQDSSPANAPRFRGLVRVGRLDRPVVVEAVSGGRTVARRVVSPAVADEAAEGLHLRQQSTEFWLTLGSQPGFEQAVTQRNARRRDVQSNAEPELDLAVLDAIENFPSRAAELDAIDLIVVEGRYDFSSGQSDALREWVETGGRLVLVVADEAAAYGASPLAAWIPAEVGGVQRVRELSALGARITDSRVIAIDRDVAVAEARMPGGREIAVGAAGPLILRSARGAGTVTLVAVSLNRPPVANWESLPALCLQLAGMPPLRGTAGTSHEGSLASTGLTDLSTQWLNLLDAHPSIFRISTWGAIACLLVYLLVVGPLDYLIVHRLLRRPHWTWFSFPLWVVIGAVAGTALAARSNGDVRLSRQVDVIDVYADAGRIVCRSWLSLYSPEMRRYEIAAQAANFTGPDSATRPLLGWAGTPEASFRGMHRRGGLRLGTTAYHVTEGTDGIRDLPIHLWSTRLLSSEWSQLGKPGATVVESGLTDDGTGRLQGTLTHRLPGAIEDWFVAYQNTIYLPATSNDAGAARPIAAGQAWTLEEAALPRALKGALTGVRYRVLQRRGPGQEFIASRTEYDPLNQDPGRVLEMISFHEAAGGREYTALEHESLGRMDLSTILGLKRAVLFGRIKAAGVAYAVDGQPAVEDEPTSFVRVVLPVGRRAAAE